MRINPYYLSLIREKGDPVWRQAVPDPAELSDLSGMDDPLSEEPQSPVPNLTHRYPETALFLVSNRCAMYCRHCMRKRKVGPGASGFSVTDETVAAGIEYIENNPVVRDVILSGGDPLLRDDEFLGGLLERLRAIPHVEMVRIHSRVPATLPQRITPELVGILKKYHPLYLNTHFNHPVEITPEAARACALLADAGIPLGCQTVLLKGVNDDEETMGALMRKLGSIRVKPYYLHHPDLVRGTGHFRTPVKKGLSIMAFLRGRVGGMCVPQYMIDLPGGGGKIPLLPPYVRETEDGMMIVENGNGEIYKYPLG